MPSASRRRGLRRALSRRSAPSRSRRGLRPAAWDRAAGRRPPAHPPSRLKKAPLALGGIARYWRQRGLSAFFERMLDRRIEQGVGRLKRFKRVALCCEKTARKLQINRLLRPRLMLDRGSRVSPLFVGHLSLRHCRDFYDVAWLQNRIFICVSFGTLSLIAAYDCHTRAAQFA